MKYIWTILIFVLIAAGCTDTGSNTDYTGTLGPTNSEADLNLALNSGKPVLLEFYAEWCTYCGDQAPILAEIKEEYKGELIVIKIDTDQNPGLIEAITGQGGLPTLLLFDRTGDIASCGAGAPCYWIGLTSKEALVQAISQNL